jgi:hypothetical protein
MWTSDKIKTSKRMVDLLHMESRREKRTCIFIDEEFFFKLAEEIMVEKPLSFQALICECGFINCSPGSWVSLRRSGDFVFLMPAFDLLSQKKDLFNYSPPEWMERRGVYWTTIEKFERIKNKVPALKKLKTIRRLTASELVSLFLFENPVGFFQACADCSKNRSKNYECMKYRICELHHNTLINRQLFSGTSSGDKEEVLDRVEFILNELRSGRSFWLEMKKGNEQVVGFTSSEKYPSGVNVLYQTRTGAGILLGDTFKVKLRPRK